jgi:acyl-CoA hydrolase
MSKTISLAQLRFADYLRPHEVIGWPQGPGEPLALTEALVAQRADLQAPVLFFGLTASNTLRPELAEHFTFRALNGAGNSRRVTALVDIVPCHVSTVPGLLRSGHLRVEVALVQIKPLPSGGFTLGVIADFTQALIRHARVVIALVNPKLPALRGDA